MRTEENWIRLYRAMYLKRLKEVTREHLPSLRRPGGTIVSSTADTTSQTSLLWIDVSHIHPASHTSSPDEQRNTADVFCLGRERRSNRGLGFGQGNPYISSSQGSTVIGPVPAHAHPVTEEVNRSFKSSGLICITKYWMPSLFVMCSNTSEQKGNLTSSSGPTTQVWRLRLKQQWQVTHMMQHYNETYH